MSPEHDPLLGTIFAGRYRVERRLGEGGMGCVYVATQLSMDRRVALKVLGEHIAGSDAAVKRFHREMRATARVEHQNTIRVHDFGESDDGKLFLTMELLDGASLHQVLRDSGALDIARALHIATQIARALGAAHHEGIVHRDLKPENIMLLDRYGEHDFVKVLDFGIARFADGARPEDGEPTLTRTGTLIGTPLYMSPEQALGKEVDGRSDLYALGVLLYQMCTGTVPFTDPTPVRVLFMHAHDAPVPPSRLTPGRVPEPVETLIMRLLDKDPAARPQTAADVARALRESTEHPTLVTDHDGGESRLSVPASMARARKQRHDPQSAIPTRPRAVTVDPEIEDGAPTTPALVPVAPLPVAAGPVATAPTAAADIEQLGPPAADPRLAARPEPVAVETGQGTIDTGAMTLVAGASAGTKEGAPGGRPIDAGAMSFAADPSAAAAASPPLGSGVRPGSDLSPPRGAPEHADFRAEDQAGGAGSDRNDPGSCCPADDPPAPASSKLPLLLAGTAVAIAVVAAVATFRGGPRSPGTPAGAEGPGPRAERVVGSAAASPSPAGNARNARRARLDALTREAGDPPTPARCEARDDRALDALVAAREALLGGKPHGGRPRDRKAAAALAALGSDNAEVQALLAKARLLAGSSDTETATAAHKALAACPEMALAHGVMGAVHLLSDRSEQAEESLDAALRLCSDYDRARFNFGLAAMLRGHAEDAIERFDRLLRADPDHPGAHLARARARLLTKDTGRALADIDFALQRAPKDANAWFLKGIALRSAGRPGKANEAFCRAADLGHRKAAAICKKPK